MLEIKDLVVALEQAAGIKLSSENAALMVTRVQVQRRHSADPSSRQRC